jgi:DNA polymerase-3 subunit beta
VKLSINRDAALSAATFSRIAASRRATIPIMGSLRLTTADDKLRFTGCDLDMEASVEIEAEVTAPGDVALDADRLYGALSNLPSGAEVALSLDQKTQRVAIQCGRARFQIPAEKGSDFPAFSGVTGAAGFDLASADLLRLLDATEFAVSRDQSRPYITGVHFHAHEESLRAVATNGALLSLASATGDVGAISQTLPLKAVALLREVAKGGETVFVRQGDALFAAQAGPLRMATKVIDQAFPDYQRIIPDPPAACDLPREALARAVARSLAVTDAKVPGARIELVDGEARVSARGERGEEMCDAFDAAVTDPFSALFNARYLHELISRFEGEALTLRYSDDRSPVIFSSDADPSRLAVLIGLRT